MAINYSMANNVTYTHKVRWRPDLAAAEPIPVFERLDFQPPPDNKNQCDSSIFTANPFITPLSIATDNFNIGRAKDMDYLFNHYIEFISSPRLHSFLLNTTWTMEDSQKVFLEYQYRICVVMYHDIWLTIIRTKDHFVGGQA